MFDRLKSKFILINMMLLTVVFLAIFGTIYIMTSTNINREINMTLDNLIKNGNINKPKIKEFDKTSNELIKANHKPIPNSDSIVVEVDNTGNILKKFQSFGVDIDDAILKNAINTTLNTESSSGTITIDSTNYSYLKYTSEFGRKIAFVDRSHYEYLMAELLKNFLLIGSISLIALFVISVYLTNKTIAPIKETFEKQKEFIANASHELKTPLTIIKTNTSLILSNPQDTVENQSKWINYINAQADRMSTLINEMLSLAKLDIAENKLTLTPINISKIMNNMILMFDAVLYENEIDLESNIQNDVLINGDQESIKKLFSIIMDNAVKHTNPGGKITVSMFIEKSKVRIIIKNTGEGIAPEHLEKIFERFYRVDSSRDRKTGGYGLGLSIATSIVKQHKGKIYAESEINKSTSFIIELPQ
ncbi:sensor histidine kinase [Clostridium ihumii]|uniref:sensor histidine kinase n=1 Tax=Clostridium ihumii TaxID=1470356 RepID=UPI003D3322A2